MKADATSTSTGAALYPDWIMRSKTKPMGRDMPRQYRMPKEDAGGGLTLEEELDAASVFDPPATSFTVKPTGYHPRGGRAEDTAALQQHAGYHSTLQLGSGGHPTQDVTHDRPRKCTPELGTGVPCHAH